MKRLMSKVKKPKDGDEQSAPTNNAGAPLVPPQGDSTEAIVVREVIAFCESAAPGSTSAGEEYLHLPAIVDGAESSPEAAKAAAETIRRYLAKEQYGRGFAQYNAIMLMRILTDNPGKNFTQNMDKEFVSTVKRLLRDSRDQGVQQILRETLDYFEAEKLPNNSTLGPLMEMWRKEKGLGAQLYQRNGAAGGVLAGSGQRGGRSSRSLPAPDELAARVEEAKTTARLLLQTMQSTPSAELARNDLVKEFAARARAAQRSIHSYMHADNPAPDDDTMMTLIETNEQLNIAMSKHHRALLAAKKQNGQSPGPRPQPDNTVQNPNSYGQINQQPRINGQSQPTEAAAFAPPPGPPPSKRTEDGPDNPFTDDAEFEQEQEQQKPKSTFSLFGQTKKNQTNEPTPEQTYMAYTNSQGTEPRKSAEEAAPSRPGGPGYTSTPSYLNRQESAANNITMHGASPPQ